ncbi:MAG: SARP family transcriptional regulator [Actinobacteria bacterium]|nr:SARP family transcriptional regulator [Actinomycetota bacterium]
MPVAIQLLGPPRIDGLRGGGYRIRSRKTWALLAYLLLSEHPPLRSQLASLLYAEADDPLRALRWNLAELRRALGDGTVLEGDPVVLDLPPDTVIDVAVLTTGSWPEAVRLPGLGGELLEGYAPRQSAAFATWLLSAQRHLAAATEAILHEAAVGSLSLGRSADAIAYASRVVALNPLDENHQALLIRLYRLVGDPERARRQYASYAELLETELGLSPGAAVESAVRERRRPTEPTVGPGAVEAVVEAGTAAIAAGAALAGIDALRAAVAMADRAGSPDLRLSTRLGLAEALIHALGGLDEEGLASLHEVDAIAAAAGDRASVARARAELGYVDFLRGRYDRATHWLNDALAFADGDVMVTAKAKTYLGSVESDRSDYPRALALLGEAVGLARQARDRRREAFASSMIGRVHLLRGELVDAGRWLDTATELATGDHWLAFLPWPQALRSEVHLRGGDLDEATAASRQAFARACQLGDPCWEGIAARGVALTAEARGDVDLAFAGLLDARERCNRLADPYVWLDAYILDALCGLGARHGAAGTASWVELLQELTARRGMRELHVRALRHGAAVGDRAAGEAAALLAQGIDNPALAVLDAGARPRQAVTRGR